MTTTSDESALLAAIIANPDDDTPRLAYADLLDYDGYSPRAEMIRVQCELATKTSGWKPENLDCLDMYLDPDNHESQVWKHEVLAIRRRESALLAAHPEWRAECPACDGYGGFVLTEEDKDRQKCSRCSGTGRVGTLRRGFLDSVTVPSLASVWERPLCKRCRRLGAFGACPTCGGSGYQTPTEVLTDYAAKKLLAPHPLLRSVVPADRVPHWNGRGYAFYNAERGHPSLDTPESANLPPLVFEAFAELTKAKVTPDHPNPHVSTGGTRFAGYATPDVAVDALGEAVCRVLRALGKAGAT